jgi:tetratricopeptide (TPR) repeat protein
MAKTLKFSILNFKFSKKTNTKLFRYFSVILATVFIFFSLVSFFRPKDSFQLLKEKIVKMPNDYEAHLQLAEIYLQSNQYQKAENELWQLRVLGTSTSKFDQLLQQKLLQNPNDVKRLIAGWEQIVNQKPNYRDGWLQLAYLNYKIYEDEKAKEYLTKALDLDPNFVPVRELEKIIGE